MGIRRFDRDGAAPRSGAGGDEARGALGCGDGWDPPHGWHRGGSYDGVHRAEAFGGGQVERSRPGLDLDLVRALPWEDALLWTWSYRGEGISARGTLKTTDTADADGFYLITAIAGERNGETITGLQPTGTPIPGNEPFAVDNLIRAEGPELTGNGFGYALEDGTYASPFFADFRVLEIYLEIFSAPPFGPETRSEDSELPVDFAARLLRPSHHGDGREDCHGHSEAHHAVDAWFV
jgi:hypothetical protein